MDANMRLDKQNVHMCEEMVALSLWNHYARLVIFKVDFG